jgi:hypothetical protein
VWAGVPAGCQCPKCRNRVGFDEPGGSTWRGLAAGVGAPPFGKKGDDHVRAARSPDGPAGAVPSPKRIAVIGAVKTRSASIRSTGHAAARPASLIARDTSNSRAQARQRKR